MRSARPYVLLFVLLLLIGAVANFAIAIRATRWMVAPTNLFSRSVPHSGAMTWPGPTPVPWPPPSMFDDARAFAYRIVNARVVVENQSTHSMDAHEFGWPLPVLAKYQYWWPWNDPQWGPSSANETGILFLWSGVIINPFIFAIPIWTLIAVPYLIIDFVRRSRMRRGLCTRCGYPLGPSGTCAECGLSAVNAT